MRKPTLEELYAVLAANPRDTTLRAKLADAVASIFPDWAEKARSGAPLSVLRPPGASLVASPHLGALVALDLTGNPAPQTYREPWLDQGQIIGRDLVDPFVASLIERYGRRPWLDAEKRWPTDV